MHGTVELQFVRSKDEEGNVFSFPHSAQIERMKKPRGELLSRAREAIAEMNSSQGPLLRSQVTLGAVIGDFLCILFHPVVLG